MMNLTDDLLRAAAADVRNAMLDALPAPEECSHTFSPEFEQKMQKLIHQQKVGHRLLRQVAAVFLALLVGSGVWLMANTEARAAFLYWVQTVYENSIVYRFFGNAPAEPELANCRPTWLPEGYVETDTIIMDSQLLVEYRNAENDVIYFQCFPMNESTQQQIILDGMSTPIEAKINGSYGLFYQATDMTLSNELFWFDEENNTVFQLSGFWNKSTMVQIAESVILSNVTK